MQSHICKISRLIAASILVAGSSTASAAQNAAPKISGTAPTSIEAQSTFRFHPTARDANGDTLKFSIVNRPAWMTTFNTKTGVLRGTPDAKDAGVYRNIIIRVSDGKSTASLPPFAVKVVAEKNQAPKITGSPSNKVAVADMYSFTPKAVDANGDTLAFTIKNKPTWTSFNTVTGKLQGTPTATHVGSYAGISISVSDGKKTVTLPSFAIVVTGAEMPGSGTGAAALSWMPPQENTDGSTLTDLAGYSIHYGTEEKVLTQSIKVTNPSVTHYVVEGLNSGNYYFSVKAYNSKGAESALSQLVSKQIR